MHIKFPELFLSIIAMITLVSCVPTTDTVNNPTFEESLSPLNSVIDEPAPDIEIEVNDSELGTSTDQKEAESESGQTSPIISDENQVEPITKEEMPTMPASNSEAPNPDKLPQMIIAKNDLANRLNISPDNIETMTVELVTWSNGGMGCPQPGMEYKQVPVDGMLIRLRVNGVEYNYHSGGARDPFLCQPSPAAKSTPLGLNIEDFITPPSGNIED